MFEIPSDWALALESLTNITNHEFVIKTNQNVLVHEHVGVWSV